MKKFSIVGLLVVVCLSTLTAAIPSYTGQKSVELLLSRHEDVQNHIEALSQKEQNAAFEAVQAVYAQTPDFWESDDEFVKRVEQEQARLLTVVQEDSRAMQTLKQELSGLETQLMQGWTTKAQYLLRSYNRNTRKWPVQVSVSLTPMINTSFLTTLLFEAGPMLSSQLNSLQNADAQKKLECYVHWGLRVSPARRFPTLVIHSVTINNKLTSESYTIEVASEIGFVLDSSFNRVRFFDQSRALHAQPDAVIDIQASYDTSLLLTADDTLWGMGSNKEGQLGKKLPITYQAPTKIAEQIIAYSGSMSSLAYVTNDGTLYLHQGIDGFGHNTPIVIDKDVIAVDCGAGLLAYQTRDGVLWGLDLAYPQAEHREKIVEEVQSFSLGFDTDEAPFLLYLLDDGTLWGLGEFFAHIGFEITDEQKPVFIDSDVVSISAGVWHGAYIKNDSTLWGFGNNEYNQLGLGSPSQYQMPAKIAEGVALVSCGAAHTLFVTEDGILWGMGHNEYGQLGFENLPTVTVPVPFAEGVRTISSGFIHSCYVDQKGILYTSGWKGGDSNYYEEPEDLLFSFTPISKELWDRRESPQSSPKDFILFVPRGQNLVLDLTKSLPAYISFGGDQPWSVVEKDGKIALRSGSITHGGESIFNTEVFLSDESLLRFDSRTSTESGYDILELSIDGYIEWERSGIRDWTTTEIPLEAGFHTISWTYYKDVSDTEGEDAVWLSNITLISSNARNMQGSSSLAFFEDAEMQSSYIASEASDEYESVAWGGYGQLVGITGTSVGEGQQNTEAIISKLGPIDPYSYTPVYAAKASADYQLASSATWHLPSLQELIILASKKQQVGGLEQKLYWSSSERDATHAWAYDVEKGYALAVPKFFKLGVRPIMQVKKAAVPPAPVAPTPAPAPAEAPAEEEIVLRISNGSEPESLDPALIQGVPEHRIFEALFEGLVANDPETALAVPGVAESWEANADGTQYTFKLRENALWSDGKPITAHDVVYSWLRILNPATGSPYAWFPCMFLKGANEYNGGEAGPEAVGIRALDDYTFQMDLIGPLPYAVDALTHYSFAIVPRHTIERYGSAWTNPANFVGNGPFVLSERVAQTSLTAVKNEMYWDKEKVKLAKVVFYSSDSDTTNYNMYLNGEIDWATNVPPDQITAAQMREDFQIAPQLATYYYVFQTEIAPLNNPLVRKALALAVDREALVEGVTKAGQIPAWGIVPPMAGYEGLAFPFDTQEEAVEEARKLLSEAGYPNGAGFPTVPILYNTNEAHKQIAQFIQQEWKNNLGINVVLENQEWQTYLSNRNQGNFQVARAGWVGDYQDPNTFLDLFITGAGMNGGKYSNETYDILLDEAARMPAGADRYGVLMTAEDIMVNQDQALMPLYYYVTMNMVDTNKWGGWYANTMDYHPLKHIYHK